MSRPSPIRNISDTARWTAMHRALETDRPDALFRDPLARRLAGERGAQIVRELPPTGEWAWAVRTHLIDRAILAAIQAGAHTVLNLAAGFDTRPYRLPLPETLRWVEVDLPAILEEKEALLGAEMPRCRLERVKLDLASVPERRLLFSRVGSAAAHAIVVSEGLLIYLDGEEVVALARDLALPATFDRWAFDLASPGLVKMVQRSWGRQLAQGQALPRFGPPEGPAYFEPAGWKVREVHSVLQAAARAKRLTPWFRLLALLPESSGRQGARPWSGVCVLERDAAPRAVSGPPAP